MSQQPDKIPEDAICHEHLIMGCTLNHQQPDGPINLTPVYKSEKTVKAKSVSSSEYKPDTSDFEQPDNELEEMIKMLSPLISDGITAGELRAKAREILAWRDKSREEAFLNGYEAGQGSIDGNLKGISLAEAKKKLKGGSNG